MYKVSVVTPFHNVDMGMFQVCIQEKQIDKILFTIY